MYIALILSKYQQSAGIYCFYITTFNQEIPINAIILKQMLTANLDTVHIVFCRTATANIFKALKMQKGFKKFDKQLVCTGIKSLMKKSNTYNELCRRKKLSHSKNLSHLN